MSEKILYIDMEKIMQETEQELKERKKLKHSSQVRKPISKEERLQMLNEFEDYINYKAVPSF